MRVAAFSVLACLLGCGPSHDGDATLPACGAAPGSPAVVRFEPALAPVTAMPIGFVTTEIERDGDAARLHLDACPRATPCPLDLVVVGTDVEPEYLDFTCTILYGTLDWDGRTAHLDLGNISACGGAPFQIEMIAGELPTGMLGRFRIERGEHACSQGCTTRLDTVVTHDAVTLEAGQRTYVRAPTLRVQVATDADATPGDCGLSDHAATGVVVSVR